MGGIFALTPMTGRKAGGRLDERKNSYHKTALGVERGRSKVKR